MQAQTTAHMTPHALAGMWYKLPVYGKTPRSGVTTLREGNPGEGNKVMISYAQGGYGAYLAGFWLS